MKQEKPNNQPKNEIKQKTNHQDRPHQNKNYQKRDYQKKPMQQKNIAVERINTLFKEAEMVFAEDKKLSNRYVSLARKIAMKYKVTLPSTLKRKFCKHCHKFLMPGINLRIRLGKHKIIYYCLECKKFWRMPIGRKSKKIKN